MFALRRAVLAPVRLEIVAVNLIIYHGAVMMLTTVSQQTVAAPHLIVVLPAIPFSVATVVMPLVLAALAVMGAYVPTTNRTVLV